MYHHHVLLNIYEEMQTVESVPCPWLLDISTLGVETGERGGGETYLLLSGSSSSFIW